MFEFEIQTYLVWIQSRNLSWKGNCSPLFSKTLSDDYIGPSLSHSRNPNPVWCRERNLSPLRCSFSIKREISQDFTMQYTSLSKFYLSIVSHPWILQGALEWRAKEPRCGGATTRGVGQGVWGSKNQHVLGQHVPNTIWMNQKPSFSNL
jgi:hypothetical protein